MHAINEILENKLLALLNVGSDPSAATVSGLIPSTFVGPCRDPKPIRVFGRPTLTPPKARYQSGTPNFCLQTFVIPNTPSHNRNVEVPINRHSRSGVDV